MMRINANITEYSLSGQSPYQDYHDSKKYFSGPLSYFIESNNQLKDIRTNQYVEKGDLFNEIEYYEKYMTTRTEALENYLKNTDENFLLDKEQYEGESLDSLYPTIISEYTIPDYINLLTLPFGNNVNDTCGPLASSILLHYYHDTVNNNFVDSEHLPTSWNEGDRDILHQLLLSYKTQSFAGGTYAPNDAQAMNAYLQDSSNRENLGYHAMSNILPSKDLLQDKIEGMQKPILIYLSPTSEFGAHVVLAYGYKEVVEYIQSPNGPISVYNEFYRVHTGWHRNVEGNKMMEDIYVNTVIGSAAWLEQYANHNHNYTIYSDRNEKIHDYKCAGCNLVKRENHPFYCFSLAAMRNAAQ